MQQQQSEERGVFDAASVARKIVDVAVDHKASDVTLIEVGEVTTIADFFVVATGSSERQLRAVANAIREAMKEDGIPLLREEGPAGAGWILLDYGQVIVHLFNEEQRAYYDLERRWVEAPTRLRIQ